MTTQTKTPEVLFPPRLVALSALLVGTLDLLSAYIDVYISTGRNSFPIVSKYIASGIAGPSAMGGGTGMIILGLLAHYLIATLFTLFFFWVYPRIEPVFRNWIITGIIYGVFIWSVMAFIVLPLSNTPARKPFEPLKVLKAAGILIFMIGLPLSYIAWRNYKKSSPDNQLSTIS